MKLTVFFPKLSQGEDFGDILARGITINQSGELFLVCAEYTDADNSRSLTDFSGLDFALNLDRGGSPMIICSFMPEAYFLKNDELTKKFIALMGQQRVCFMRLPFTPADLEKKFQELMEDKREEDLLAIELNNLASYNDIMGTIQHRVSSYFRDEQKGSREAIASAVAEARERLGLTGSDEEITMQIKNFRHGGNQSPFVGKFFPGVFCDIENTLLIDGKVSSAMLEKLQELSKTKPITLWTGATLDMQSIQGKLIECGITWKLVAKNSFSGAEVEIAYDDEEFEIFFDKYKVKVREYIQI